MIKSRIAVAGALLAAAGAANAAGLTITPTIATDYDFRGISQTNPDNDGMDPAFQLGANYSFDNGFYAGVWGSNVDFGTAKPDVEIDYTIGFAGGDAVDGIGFDLGATYYHYLSAGSLNTLEVYAGISRGWFSGKLWFSDDYASSGNSGFYLEGNANIPLSAGFNLLAHVGTFDAQNAKSYFDYSIGVGYNIGRFATTVKYVNSNDFPNVVVGRNAWVGTISTTFPWSE